MKKLVFLFLFITSLGLFAQKQIKVSCVGNSITFGTGVEQREKNSYPSVLQQMLGKAYLVENFGKPGATLLKKGHRPYMEQEEFRKALEFAADIVVIHLGINDTDPRNWANYRDFFVRDYVELIDSFKKVNPKARVIIARMTPITHNHPRFDSGTRDWHNQIQSAIQNIAKYTNVQLIDFHEPLYRYPNFIPDAIHPNKQGAEILAKVVYSAITGDFGGLKMPEIYSDNMVLQRDYPINIEGTANAGDKVTIALANQKMTTKTSDDGKWEVKLKAISAAGPYKLEISTQKQKIIYNNVLIGDVWLCSGQSNMEFYLNQSSTAKQDLPKVSNDRIRFFDMKARWRTDAVEWDTSVLDSLNNLQYYKNTKWTQCSPSTAEEFSAVAYYFGKMLQDSLNVPIGLICNAIGGAPIEAWVDRGSLEYQFPSILREWNKNDFIQGWVKERASLNIKKTQTAQQRHPYHPSYLYETGIVPLNKFPIKGVIWYQGESNAHNVEAYQKLFGLLVDGWRKYWDNEKMPVYYVQLSSIDRASWTWFREAQRKIEKQIPNISMVVSSDKGDSLDVHPRDKKPIGERLARAALYNTYDLKHITPSGPMFKSVDFSNSAAYVSFDFSEGLKTSDNKPIRTFEIAEYEDVYYPANAQIVGDKIKVWNENVKNPRYLRYGWQPFTRANIVNKDDLPASSFRTN